MGGTGLKFWILKGEKNHTHCERDLNPEIQLYPEKSHPCKDALTTVIPLSLKLLQAARDINSYSYA